MKILAMDTSTLVMGLAVIDGETSRVLGEVTTNLHKNHSVRLMPALSQLLTDLDLTLDDLGALAVTSGPGSYTGIRIGVTTAKTMAWARQLPLYSESSLTVLAMNGYWFEGVVVPLFDARRQRVYSGTYQREGEQMKEMIPQQVIELDTYLPMIKELNQPVLFLGDDVSKFTESIQEVLGEQARFATPAEQIPRPSQLGFLALQKWKHHQPAEQADFTPNYLQMTQAETNWLKKQRSGENRDD
ncbi:tRNA (adenosine(37)-N6)-threonylcarbamoyltransferase complex dimerization subunit type 1 TsaB [Hazenella coriacea]|uniref:tRNA threonylcarbamoyladenosine biosynthesis protein TsaB n=1 Tax=Hazenella coriacea TaxID=1179467 RepID=A0A4R3L140_9BACL|nr:tRNA (adenosine(37)-N6)-threonylcarbamoyltransferase complex dimerization subunit type 1 TsaB [Hazenella coriacea]TCS93283.1 tRNA threonylcarbamoyladenosine biosynthesis protein TsaB [Hazenella coriacea]